MCEGIETILKLLFYYIHFTSNMIPISVIKYIFVIIILNPMLNICAGKYNEHAEEVLIDTRYKVEKVNLVWSIDDYSQIFSTVQTQFVQNYTSTTWVLSLQDKKIFLKRVDTGEPVKVNLNFTLETPGVKLMGEMSGEYDCLRMPSCQANFAFIDMEDYYQQTKMPVVNQNDVFILKITMKILGPPKSKIVRSLLKDNEI